ncbi:alpha/beta hydrolase [Gimibacter soli]|uniref:Alpha/beta hydrolase n=1 Tax=Gimibacter soli TaxID=3024400 RepID=A0AAE9XMP3_9PROT|nr:alpha/beta hydrolase [Gimibacter soli]WCL52867.1 alpha/beta hydrolase [Gimibacter soli]
MNFIKALSVLAFTAALTGAVAAQNAVADDIPLCGPDTLDTGGPARCRAPNSDATDILIIRPGTPATPARLPLVYIFGGPGLYPDRQFPRMQALANRWQRTLLVAVPPGLDSRVNPALVCAGEIAPRLWEAANTPEAAEPMTSDPATPLAACLGHIGRQSNSTTALSTATAAARLAAALAALDAGKVDILAESYGARIALDVAARRPDLVHSLALDSPETPWVPAFWHSGQNLMAALDRLEDACGYRRKCPTRGRRMAEKLMTRLAAFNQASAPAMRLRDQTSGEVLGYVRPARAHLELRLISALASPVEAGHLPYIAASRSDADLQRRFARLVSGYVLDDTPALSFAVHHIVRCSEWPMTRWYKALDADAATYPTLRPMLAYLKARQQHICTALGVTPPDSIDRLSAPLIPTFVLSGTLDPVTPANSVENAFSGDPMVQRRLYENAGHVVQLAADCVLDDIDAFFQNPKGQAPSSCKRDNLQIPFFQPISVR